MKTVPDETPSFSRAKFEEVTLGDRDLQQQLLRSFLGQVDATKTQALASANAGRAEFDSTVHRLKSTCHYVGAERLLAHLLDVEASPRMDSRATRVAAAERIVELLGELERELSSVMRELLA